MLKHFLNEYPITPGRIIDEHMCNGPDQFPVLYRKGRGGLIIIVRQDQMPLRIDAKGKHAGA